MSTELATMTPAQYRMLREGYSYQLASVSKPLDGRRIEVEFGSTYELDEYHRVLLCSHDERSVVSGYLGVLYWGFLSGKDDRIRPDWAWSKVEGARKKLRSISRAAHLIALAKRAIADNQYANALLILVNLPGLQIAFASKVCSFLAPDKCGVTDRVIARSYGQIAFDLCRRGYVISNEGNAEKYEQYCLLLQAEAKRLNRSNTKWCDADGALRIWRAVDIERAMYVGANTGAGSE